MPRLRRKPKQRRLKLIGPAMREYLATGYNLEIQLRRKPSEDELRAAWDQIGDELVAGMAAGHRPYGWWRFEAPSPRRLWPDMPNLEHPALKFPFNE